MSVRIQKKIGSFCLAAALSACSANEAPSPSETGPSGRSAWELTRAPIPDIIAALEAGEITSEELAIAYTARVAHGEKAVGLNAIIRLNPDLKAQAAEIDARRAAGEDVGLLAGLPILIKDNIETADNMPTTAGSLALKDNFAVADAPLVAKLRENGALILGKANLSEWANFRSNRSQSGWSGVLGRTRNAYDLDRQACGSSSGSAVGTAAAMAAGAVGTETNGSIICPSQGNGIVGFKPTLGVVAQDGVVPIAFSQDTAGPMTRSVEGAAMMLTAMATNGAGIDYTATLSDTALEGKRIGVLRFSVSEQPGLAERFDAALAMLEAQGAELVEIEAFDLQVEDYGRKSMSVLVHEFKTTIDAYLAATPDTVTTRSLADLIAFNEENAPRELPIFGQDIFELSEATNGVDDPTYQQALADVKRGTGELGIDALLADHDVDVLVSPSGPIMPVVDENGPDNWPQWSGAGYLAAVAGYPHLTVPMGQVDRVPIGLSFMSTAGKDGEVLAFGYDYEQASQMRVPPSYIEAGEN
ncbi:MAG: amidase [Ponticaulis sp.]|nr:amidase [Ponticaulis sp.]|tara:strand:- start:23768 stop:25354 length:1587 start_codon:yes stop_codon:yes gene_type:complete